MNVPTWFLHLRKTGGTAVLNALAGVPGVTIADHFTTLAAVPAAARIAFIIRDPVERAVSGFYDRCRLGAPGYACPLAPDEAQVADRFHDAQALAVALPAPHAAEVLDTFTHTRWRYWQTFIDEKALRARRDSYLYVLFQPTLDEDFAELARRLGCPGKRLPTDETLANRAPDAHRPRIEGEGYDKLRAHYAADYAAIEAVLRCAPIGALSPALLEWVKRGMPSYWTPEPKRVYFHRGAKKVFDIVVLHDPKMWGKWPGSNDMNYRPIFDIVGESGRAWAPDIVLRMRYGPVYAPRAWAGHTEPRPIPWDINNQQNAPTGVASGMLYMLRELSKRSTVLLWPDARECYPDIAREIPPLFPVRILTHADDCVWSSPLRTLPVCAHFTHLIHWMRIYDQSTGELVKNVYARHGIPADHCYHGAYGNRSGVEAAIADHAFDPNNYARKVEHDLMFVGAAGLPGFRTDWLARLNQIAWPRPRAVLHGIGMRDGFLLPTDHPKGVGYPVFDLMQRSFATVNIGLSSIFNNRLWDAWRMGVLQFCVDPHNELPAQGFEPGTHYVCVTTPEELLAGVEAWKRDPAKVARVVRDAYHACIAHLDTHDMTGTLIRLLRELP
jgi:hypothetical protein